MNPQSLECESEGWLIVRNWGIIGSADVLIGGRQSGASRQRCAGRFSEKRVLNMGRES